MITVRVNSVSSGSGYPRIVYNSRHERMGDAMVLNGTRGEPTRFEKNKRGKEKERSEKNSKIGRGGGDGGEGTSIQVQYPSFVETIQFKDSAKDSARLVRLGSVREGI